MKTLLKINFDSIKFNTSFKIENPPVLPLEGEVFSAKWDDFICDQKILQALEEYEDGNVFFVSVINKHFTKDYLDVNVLLVEESQYQKP